MSSPSNEPTKPGRLAALLGYLKSDPDNLSLLSEAAGAAVAESQAETALDLLARHQALAPLADRERNLRGLACMKLGDFAEAAGAFEDVLTRTPHDPALRFNLAWSKAMLKDGTGALEWLDPATVDTLPQAAMLHVQVLHEQGRFEEAAGAARAHIARHPDHQGLMAAVSVLALDIEDPALAAACAAKGGDLPDALTTLGTLALGEYRNGEALGLFERALAQNRGVPRAWIGSGLAKLMAGQHTDAAADLDRGAAMFEDHLGSWIAAGWAQILAGDVAAGRQRFETALAHDATFSESHGSLAVTAIMEGRLDEGRRLAQVALRLDPQSFSGALAHAMLLANDGKPDFARKIIDRALNTPLGADGRTIAHALVKQGLSM